jgi:hypothetical protein
MTQDERQIIRKALMTSDDPCIFEALEILDADEAFPESTIPKRECKTCAAYNFCQNPKCGETTTGLPCWWSGSAESTESTEETK